MRAGRIVSDLTGGMADSSEGIACGLDTQFQLASVSKSFTAAAVLLLVDAGKISVADRVPRWLDRCPTSWKDMTIHQLLTHTAGLPHWHDLPAISLTQSMAAGDELDIFRGSALRSSPGEGWYYSSPGYVLLAHIVQRSADQPYREFLHQRVFTPLQLWATYAGNAGDRPSTTVGHVEGVAVPSFELDTVGMGAGDIWSTVGDVMRWDASLMGRGFLSQASRRAMFQIHVTLPSQWHLEEGSPIGATGYGYGWFLGRGLGKDLVVHPGDNAGFKSVNLVVPSLGIRLAVLVNDEASACNSVAVDLLKEALEDRPA